MSFGLLRWVLLLFWLAVPTLGAAQVNITGKVETRVNFTEATESYFISDAVFDDLHVIDADGGAVSLWRQSTVQDSFAWVNHCLFRRCSAIHHNRTIAQANVRNGGALYLRYPSVEISRSCAEDCEAGLGGVIYIEDADHPPVNWTDLYDNRANWEGIIYAGSRVCAAINEVNASWGWAYDDGSAILSNDRSQLTWEVKYSRFLSGRAPTALNNVGSALWLIDHCLFVNNTCQGHTAAGYLLYVQEISNAHFCSISSSYFARNSGNLVNSRAVFSFQDVVSDVKKGSGANWTEVGSNLWLQSLEPSLCAVRRRVCVIIATCPTGEFSVSGAFAPSKRFTASSPLIASSALAVSFPIARTGPTKVFTPSDQLRASPLFGKSALFVNSPGLRGSGSFSGSVFFSPSQSGSLSSVFLASSVFSGSDRFGASPVLSVSEVFRPTIAGSAVWESAISGDAAISGAVIGAAAAGGTLAVIGAAAAGLLFLLWKKRKAEVVVSEAPTDVDTTVSGDEPWECGETMSQENTLSASEGHFGEDGVEALVML